MSSVTKIETAIQKLSIAEQRIIARHLGERLVDEECSGGRTAVDEGIRFLPRYESCPAPRQPPGRKPGKNPRRIADRQDDVSVKK